MGVATLGGHLFRLDPLSISWTYKIKAASTDTVGGRVVQVVGVQFGDMTVQGMFGTGGWQEQQAFLAEMVAMAQSQVATNQAAFLRKLSPPPVQFLYPPKNWDFLVYLKDYSQPGGAGTSVTMASEIINPQWQLTLAIVDANGGLDTLTGAAQDDYISRLSAGLGWPSTSAMMSYQGAITQADADSILAGQSVEEYAFNVFGGAGG